MITMNKFFANLFTACILFVSTNTYAQSDSIVLRDITSDNSSPAGFMVN